MMVTRLCLFSLLSLSLTASTVFTSKEQYLQIKFGGTSDIDTISNNIDTIINIFEFITKIDASYWSVPDGSWSDYDSTINFAYIYTDFAIQSNTDTQNKLKSFKEWLDYDKEQFIVLFNTHSDIIHLSTYITGISDGYISNYYNTEANTTLGIINTFDYFSKDSTVSGHGILYSYDNNFNLRLFCNNSWQWTETQVACKSMGYDFGIYMKGALAAIYDDFSYYNTYYGNVNCSGQEDTLWDCEMSTNASDIIPECHDIQSAVVLYCIRFFPIEDNIVRIFQSYDSYNNFLPLVYGASDNTDEFVTICQDSNIFDTIDIADALCDLFSLAPGINGSSIDTLEEYYISSNISSAEITTFDYSTGEWELNKVNTCATYLIVECSANDGCNKHKMQCSTDLDCCQTSSNHLFCHPQYGNCVDIREIAKPDGYGPCYSQSECESGFCLDPGSYGICTPSTSISDFCFHSYHNCFDDKQCCDGYYCEYGYCQQDWYNGAAPIFTQLNQRKMSDPDQVFEVYGQNLRSQMLFKLSSNDICSADRSPVSDIPTIWHYSDRGELRDDYIQFAIRGLYTTRAFGALLLCYAVNDYATYQSTGLYITVPRLINNAQSNSLISAGVNWIQGSNVFVENSTNNSNPNYIEYELVLSRGLGVNEYIELDMLDNDYDNLMYPQTSWFYHQEKYISEAISFVFDEDMSNPLVSYKGYRDSTNSHIPITVRVYWNNDGYPEIMDRKFYVIHTINHGYIKSIGYIDSFKLTDIEFILIDDDPTIQSNSFRFEGESTSQGTNHLIGSQSGDETLVFTCYGCGTAETLDLINIGYGPSDNRDFYAGNDIYVTNTIDIDHNEITASYISFTTSYVPYIDAPSTNLRFKISISSRFNHSLTKIMEPDFNFSYPTDIDTTIPVITKISGQGCMNIGKRALNCPTDGKLKYDGTAARITLFGTQFPDTKGNTTVEVTIDGMPCDNVLFSIYENNDGLRNVSCEFGSGVSAHGTDGYSYVQLSYFTNEMSKFSEPVRYFNYSHPEITQIVGCNQNVSNLHTANCSRTGGGVNKLRIFGTNFGKSGARVFIGGHVAIETLHDADELHTLLYVSYGPGTRLNEKIMVMNSRGGTTTTQAYISYNQCPVGYRQQSNPEDLPNNDGYKCFECEAGTYSNTENADTCFECEAGKYQPNNGSNSCIPCEVGTYATGSGNSECNECAAGFKSETIGSIECVECSEGQFTAHQGASSCAACNENSFSIKSERNRCLCDQGYYMYEEETVQEGSNLTRVKCQDCGEGMVCTHSGLNYSNIQPETHYMPMIHTTTQTLKMIKCINTACVGGTQRCAKGFTGVLCTDCEDGLGKTSGHGCETCLPPVMNALRLLGVFICVSFIMIFFIRTTIRTAQKAKSDLSTIGKIGFSFLQFNSLALLFDYEFPPIVKAFLKVQQQPATIANGVLSVDCFVKHSNNFIGKIPSLYVKAIAYLILPVFICVVCRIVFCKYLRKSTSQHHVDTNIKRRRRSLSSLSRMELPVDSKCAAYVNAWNHYITAVIITIFMIHPQLVEMTFALLNCKQLGAYDDDYYLIQDMQIKCLNNTVHLLFVIFVAMPMLIFYVFGMPLFVLYRLYLNRDELTKDFEDINKNVVNRYHFLFKGYEPQFYYWEIIIMIRKILMVSIAVFFSYDIQIQALLATLLVVVALCIHSLACPYTTETMDGLELLSLFGSFCTYFFGQFLFTDSVSDIGKTLVSFIIIFVNIVVVVAVVLLIAGKGLVAVTAFGKKFRQLICCKKGSKSPKAEECNINNNTSKRQKTTRKEQTSENDYGHVVNKSKSDLINHPIIPNDQVPIKQCNIVED